MPDISVWRLIQAAGNRTLPNITYCFSVAVNLHRYWGCTGGSVVVVWTRRSYSERGCFSAAAGVSDNDVSAVF